MILTNQAFFQSRVWREATVSICGPGETPDDLPAWRQAWRLWRRARGASAVVTMGPRPSLAYALLCAATFLPSRQIVCEAFLDDPRPGSLLWRLKTRLWRWVARRILGVLVNSSPERDAVAERWRIPVERVLFVPICTTIREPRAVPPDSPPVVVCAGRTLRDLPTLFAAAPKIRARILLVTSMKQPLPGPVPPNMEVRREIPLDAYRDLLSRAAVVALPLLPAPRSTGQVVFLEAMSFAKPVVTTRAFGTVDYLEDGKTGLLVPPADPDALADAVNALLGNPARAAALGQAALSSILARYSPDAHATLRLDAIRALSSPRGA